MAFNKAFKIKVNSKREDVLSLAKDLGIVGYVIELSDGSLEIFAKGERVDRFIEELKRKGNNFKMEELSKFYELSSIDEKFEELREEMEELRREFRKMESKLYEGKTKIIKRSIKIPTNYFKENWGAPFIIAFMLLLISAAIYLAIGLSNVANEIAIYAYYSLVLGVVLQIASYIKYRPKEEQS
ncbi:hypothetical protein HRbin06_00206 [archaeon HR06]|nr:hypothetical protein HRbin06_00206 [archaeon HR06]